MEERLNKRYEDNNPNKRNPDGCLFTCGDHGEWRERLKVLDHIPDIVVWMNTVKSNLNDLPEIIAWMNKEQGSRSTGRWIIGVVIGIFLTGFISSAIMFKNDMVTNLNSFKLENIERINIFKLELSERQAALKLELSERQRVNEQNDKEQNAAYTIRINSIVDAVADMKTQTGIMLKLNEQSQKQLIIDRDETKTMIKDLREMVFTTQNGTRSVKN